MEETDEYAPKPQPSPFERRYVGSGGMTVIASGGTVHLAATEPETQTPARQTRATVAADEFADMDFIVSAVTSSKMSIQKGELSFVKWNGSAFTQASKAVVADEDVTVSLSDARQYIHLIVPLTTHVSTAGSIGARAGPWQEYDETISASPFTGYTYALTTEWQGPHATTVPYYLVSPLERLRPTDEFQSWGGDIGDEDVFRVLIASVINGVPSQHHAGGITISQGYIAGIEQA